MWRIAMSLVALAHGLATCKAHGSSERFES